MRPADAAMLDYAVKLTRHPGAMDESDVEALRAAGFGDRAILDICQIVAYYNYVNRLADGLGVELEPGWREVDFTLSRREFDALRRGGRPPVSGAASAVSGAQPADTARDRP